MVLIVFAHEFVVEFQDCVLEFLIGQVLTTANQFFIFIVEFESIEEKSSFSVFVPLPIILNFGNSLIFKKLVDLTLNFIVLPLIFETHFHLLNLTELCHSRELIEAEAHWLKLFVSQLSERQHIWILELVLYFVAW